MTGTRRAVVAVMAFLVFGATLMWRARDVGGLDTRTFVLPSGFAGTEIAPKGRTPEPVAIIFHGYHCNRVMMTPLGRHLARAGMRVFLLDYPGHGDTHLPLDDSQIPRQSARAFDEIVSLYAVSPDKTAVIGHSYGTHGVMALANAHASIASSVFIGPGYYGGATTEIPRNALVLTAEHDHAHIFGYTRQLFAGLTNGAEPILDRPVGQEPFLRLWKSVPGSSHVGMLVSPVVFDDTLGWVRRHGTTQALGAGRSPVRASAAAAAAAVLFFVVVVAVIPVGASATQGVRRGGSSDPPIEILLLLITTPIAALIVLFSLDPLGWLGIIDGSAVVSMLTISGLLAAIATRRRQQLWAGIRRTDLAIAAGYFALLYLLMQLTVSKDLYDLSFTLIPDRLVAFVVFAACSTFFFLVVGGMLARLHAAFVSRPARLLAMAAAIGCLSFGLPFSLWLVGPGMWRFYASVAMLFLFISGLSALTLELHRNSVVPSLLGGLLVGWITSIGFAYH